MKVIPKGVYWATTIFKLCCYSGDCVVLNTKSLNDMWLLTCETTKTGMTRKVTFVSKSNCISVILS